MFVQSYKTGKLSQTLLFIACLGGIIGLFASRALVSLSPVLGVMAIFANPNVRQAMQDFRRNWSAWGLIAMYGILVVSYFLTENVNEWQTHLFRQMPWIGLPLIIGLAVPLTDMQRRLVGLTYVGVAGIVALATSIKYLLNQDYVNALVHNNQNMPSALGVFHIHFGVMLALAVCFGIILVLKAGLTPLMKWMTAIAVFSCVLTLHLLAYRTGLLALYAVGVVAAGFLLTSRPKWALVILLFVLVTPVLSYYSMEAVRRRVTATIDDVEHFTQHRNINNYSIARRMAAWTNAVELVRASPVLGVGPADAFDAMMAQYDRQSFGLRYKNRVMLHNQYLHVLVGSGIIGLGLWLWVLFRPLFLRRFNHAPAIVSFLVILSTAMLVDSLLEMQLGMNTFLFLYCFLVVGRERAIITKQQRLTAVA